MRLVILAALLLCIAACSQAPTPTPTPKQPKYTEAEVVGFVTEYLKEKTIYSTIFKAEMDCWHPWDELSAWYDFTNSRWVVYKGYSWPYSVWYFYEPVRARDHGLGGTIEIVEEEGVNRQC